MRKFFDLILPVLLLIFSVTSGIIIHNSTSFVDDQHFSKLAKSFIHNDLFLSPYNLPAGDFADYQGKQYLFFGPLPSIILMPFVFLFGENFPQFSLSMLSLVLTYTVVYFLCKKLKFSSGDSLWLSNFFVFGTVLYFVSLVNISAYLVQALSTLFVMIAIFEYFSRKRWLFMGCMISAAILTRVTLIGFVIFFILEIFRAREINLRRSLILFIIPIILSISLLGIYNFKRFYSVFDTGYTRNVTVLGDAGGNHVKGFFNISHIPANLYVLFLMTYQPVKDDSVNFFLKFPYLKADGHGLAIWLTSPLFIYLVKSKKKAYTYNALITITILALPSLLYFGIGTTQSGYRYGLDFIPLLFLILVSAFEKGLTPVSKFLIAGGLILNCAYMLSIWNSYPLFFWIK